MGVFRSSQSACSISRLPLYLSYCSAICSVQFLVGVIGWCHRGLIFLGGLSLEIYLIHNHFVMHYLMPYHLGYWPTALLTTLLTLPLAWLLQQILKRLISA